MAEETDVPYIDLNELSAVKLEAFGPEKMNYHFHGDKIHTSRFWAELNARSAAEGIAACQHPAIAGLQQCLADLSLPVVDVKREVAKMVVMGMKQLHLPLADHLLPDWQDFDPAHPDDWNTFFWDNYRLTDTTKPDGN